MMTINCPKCNAAMQVDESAAGQTVQCYACQTPFQVPAAAPVAAAPVAAAPAAAPAAPAAPAGPNAAQAALANAQAQAAAVAGKALSSLTGGTDKLMQSKFGKYLPIWISLVALILAIVSLVLIIFCDGGSSKEFNFSGDAETTAERIFAAMIDEKCEGVDEEAYFWQKFRSDVLGDAEYEVLEDEDGEYAVVLIKSEANGKAICRVVSLVKNDDGKWILSDDLEDADEDWLEEVGEKARKHLEKDESRDIKYDNID